MKKIILIAIAVILLVPSYAFARINWTSGYDRANGTHYWLEEDGTLKPGTDNNVDIGTSALQVKKVYLVDGWTCAFTWASENILANMSASTTYFDEMPVMGNPDVDGGQSTYYYTMPFAGNVLGISVYSNAAQTAGYASFYVTVNDVSTGLVAGVDLNNNTQTHQSTQAGSNDTFSAGDRVGIDVRTDSGHAPATSDFVVTVIVGFDL